MGKKSAVKKVEIAIDKMSQLQDAGYGCDKVSRILESLNALRQEIEITVDAVKKGA